MINNDTYEYDYDHNGMIKSVKTKPPKLVSSDSSFSPVSGILLTHNIVAGSGIMPSVSEIDDCYWGLS